MNFSKAPGTDGLNNTGFYKNNWNIIKKDTINVVKNVFNSGFILKELNKTLIPLKMIIQLKSLII